VQRRATKLVEGLQQMSFESMMTDWNIYVWHG